MWQKLNEMTTQGFATVTGTICWAVFGFLHFDLVASGGFFGDSVYVAGFIGLAGGHVLSKGAERKLQGGATEPDAPIIAPVKPAPLVVQQEKVT